MRVLQDLTQKPRHAQVLGHVVVERDGLVVLKDKPMVQAPSVTSRTVESTGRVIRRGRVVREGWVQDPAPWNKLHMPERVATTPPTPQLRASGGRRQHQPQRNVVRLYRPQDQRNVQTVFVIMDRDTGQVLARVRGGAAHCEIEAEKLARSQGFELADLKVVFEGELA